MTTGKTPRLPSAPDGRDVPPSPTVADKVVVVAATDEAQPAAEALAQRLNLRLGEFSSPTNGLRLVRSDADLSLHDPGSGARLRVDFRTASHGRSTTGRDPLRRAIGAVAEDVVDATAGLGGDTIRLVAMGYRVTAIERNQIVSALVEDALARARAEGTLDADNPRWLVGDARLLLRQIQCRAATIYLDPMFPPKRKKSAAVRKERVLLRRLGIDESDAVELLAIARECTARRVVVKRPIDASPLADGAIAAYAGKLVRFDVYHPARVSS